MIHAEAGRQTVEHYNFKKYKNSKQVIDNCRWQDNIHDQVLG